MRNIVESHEVVKGIHSRIVVLGRRFLARDHLLLLLLLHHHGRLLLLLHHHGRLLLLLHHHRRLLLSRKLLLDVWLLCNALSSVRAPEVKQLGGINLLGWRARRINRLDLGKNVIDGTLGFLFLSRHRRSVCCVKVHRAKLLIDVFGGGWHCERVVCEDLRCCLLRWLDLGAAGKDHGWAVLIEEGQLLLHWVMFARGRLVCSSSWLRLLSWLGKLARIVD